MPGNTTGVFMDFPDFTPKCLQLLPLARLSSVSGSYLSGFSGGKKQVSPRSLSSDFSNFRFCPI
jgi:hypothetical protein